MKHVLLVEDNETFARGLRQNLELDGYRVTVTADGEGALALLDRQSVDLVVLDVMLPGTNGYEVLRRMRARDEVTPVLLLTALAEEAHKVRGFRLGADDYVTKPFGLLELLARIEALLRRTSTGTFQAVRLPPVRFGEVCIERDTQRVTRGGQAVALTPKEYALLVALVARNGAVAPRETLLREVWGYSDGVVSRTLDTHVAELRRKLEPDPRIPRYIMTVPKAGYRLAMGDEAAGV